MKYEVFRIATLMMILFVVVLEYKPDLAEEIVDLGGWYLILSLSFFGTHAASDVGFMKWGRHDNS